MMVHEYGVASTNFDGDGNPTKRNIVIDNGILKNIFMTIFMQKIWN